MGNIICRNSWKKVGCCNGATDEYKHAIQIVNGEKILHEFLFPFQVYFSESAMHFKKDGKETTVLFSKIDEDKTTAMSIIQNCTSVRPMERRTLKIIVDTTPVTDVDLVSLLNDGESLADIYDVYIPQYVTEGSEANEYTITEDGISFNTTIPVEPENWVIVITYWVYV